MFDELVLLTAGREEDSNVANEIGGSVAVTIWRTTVCHARVGLRIAQQFARRRNNIAAPRAGDSGHAKFDRFSRFRLTDDYVSTATDDVSLQLSKAGVRLAMILNQALRNPDVPAR